MYSLVDVAVGGHSYRRMVADRRKFYRPRFEEMVNRTGIVDHIDLRVRRADWSIACRFFGSKVWPQIVPSFASHPHDSRMDNLSVAIREREYEYMT